MRGLELCSQGYRTLFGQVFGGLLLLDLAGSAAADPPLTKTRTCGSYRATRVDRHGGLVTGGRARQHPAACERAQSGGRFREAGAASVVVVPGGGRVHMEWVSLAGKFSGPTHA